MAGLSLATQRAAIAAALGTITTLRVHAYLEPNPPMPCAMVTPPDEGDLEATFDGSGVFAWSVLLLWASRDDWRRAQESLDGYLAPTGASSLLAALNANDTLAGRIGPVTYTEYGPGEYAGKPVFGCRINFAVLT